MCSSSRVCVRALTCPPATQIHVQQGMLCWGMALVGSLPPASNFTALTLSLSGAGCALRSDGTIACFGNAAYGQTLAPASSGWVKVSCGLKHCCGLRNNGTHVCWGDNAFGQSDPVPLVVGTGRFCGAGRAGAPGAACTPCATGSFARAFQTACLPCVPGSYASAVGSSSCTLCPAGTAGSATAAALSSACAVCAGGTYAPVGASRCIQCPPGSFADAGAAMCTACPSGTLSYANATGCVACGTATCAATSKHPTLALGTYNSCFVTASTGEILCIGNVNPGYGSAYGAAGAGAFVAVQTGDYNTCGLRRDGSLSCWCVRAPV